MTITDNFDNAKLLFELGVENINKELYEKAEIYLSQSLTLMPNRLSTISNLSKVLIKLDKLEKANEIINEAVKLYPAEANLYLIKGQLSEKEKKWEISLNNYNIAIELNNNLVEAYIFRGDTLKELKRPLDALISYDKAIELNPELNNVITNRVEVIEALKKSEELLLSCENSIIKKDYESALELINKAIEIDQGNFYAYNNLGNIYNDLNFHKEAVHNYKKAININNMYAEPYYNSGVILQKMNNLEDSLTNYEAAINNKINYPEEAYYNKGLVLFELMRYEDAISDFKKVIEINSKNNDAYLMLANTFYKLKKIDNALENYNKYIEINPKNAVAYLNRGNLLNENNQLDLALDNYNKAIELNNSYGLAYFSRADLFKKRDNYELAFCDYTMAIKLEPKLDYLTGLYLQTKMHMCNWEDYEINYLKLLKEINENKKAITCFSILTLTDSPSIHHQVAKIWIGDKNPVNLKLGPILKIKNNKKIKIAYFSADLYYHPASIWLAEQLENHDKGRFELYAFSLKLVSDPMQARLQMAFDQWIDVRGMSDIEVAQLSRDLKIDIAIDLNGFTQDSRTNIFAARAAPIQVNNIGYPGSTGTDYIDYFIADPYGVTQENQVYFTEKIAFVPSGYTYDRHRLVSKESVYRSQYGLPEDGFVFTCQNGCHKFNPEVFSIWMEILNTVSGSVLWLLKPTNATAIENLKKEARQRGIDDERLVFTGREVVPIEQENQRISRYLASYKLADLFLDTWPYNAGTTAVDALWAGTPVLTKVGHAVSARMCYSALKQIDVPELITYTAQEYKDLAISLATEPQKLKFIKDKVQSNRMTTSLFDPVGNTRHIENAYLEMYRRYQEDLPLDDIYL